MPIEQTEFDDMETSGDESWVGSENGAAEDGGLATVSVITRPNLRLVPGSEALIDFDNDPLEPEEWQERALCAETDPEAFFPEKGGSTREAKRICTGCTVKDECLEYALANDERFGIWGGLSERERRRLKRGYV